MMQQSPPCAGAIPEPLRAHAKKVEALVRKMLDMLNTSGETDPSVVLDVVLNVYLNAASSYGRQVECAHHLVQIGGQLLIADAIQKQAAGLDPFEPSTVH
jgi:hypothetical protein